MLQLPEKEESVWRDAYPSEAAYPKLITQVRADVAIVGGGITGLTAAYELVKAGKSVVVLEKDTIGAGTTGRTTGKITSQHGLPYAKLWKDLGKRSAQIYADVNQYGVKRIGEIIQAEKIECDYEESASYVFTDSYQKIQYLKHEAEIAADLGLPAKFVTDTPLPFTVKAAVKFSKQARFHAQKYLLGLAEIVDNERKSHVFEHSRAIGIREGTPCRVSTLNGVVEAKHIIVATHIPPFPSLARTAYALLEYPTESFAVAGPIERLFPGMFYSPDSNHFSIQPIRIEGQNMIIVVGAGGNIPGLGGDSRKRYEKLASYAEKRFGLQSITHRWSDMDYFAYDGLPLVGKLYPWSRNTYVATGFRKWGLSMGTAAASLLRDLVIRQKNPWQKTLASMRSDPIKRLPRTAYNYLRSKT